MVKFVLQRSPKKALVFLVLLLFIIYAAYTGTVFLWLEIFKGLILRDYAIKVDVLLV